MDRPSLTDALRHRETVLRAFVGADGRLASIPTKIGKRLVVLDLVAQDFELGEIYDERTVNEVLKQRHPDFAALRRYLVEEGFLTRRDGTYWRSGGTTDV
ncbi:hypothetical protein BCF74_107103 [Knoellia remsis]|uniref:DUF2087 domain-containing protein n=1 Tax=Knoellia remsis TaxID=407159 RepID=A0A2T0UR59_9MICO|nr:DUF2087 domain-containing protein [Knoellia remsis]PRY60317.1 hypothetical protein BCF74_107103 [Knoellia remsis]